MFKYNRTSLDVPQCVSIYQHKSAKTGPQACFRHNLSKRRLPPIIFFKPNNAERTE